MVNRYWVNGTGNWDGSNTANWDSVSGGAGGLSVPTASDDVFFDGNSGTGTCTIATTTALAKSLTTTGYTQTLAGTVALTVSGNVTLGSGMTWSHSGTFTINATGTLTTNGITLNNLTKSVNGTTLTFADNVTVTNGVSLNAGTLDLNGKTLNCGQLNSNNTNTKTLAFGSAGVVNITGTGTVLNFAQVGPTVTGSRTVNIITGGSTLITVTTTSLTTSSGFDLNITAGSFTLNMSGHARNVDFTGFSGAWTLSGGTLIFGNLTVSTGMSISASTQSLTLNLASATQTIRTNGKTFDFPITQNGSGGTVKLLDGLTMGSTRGFTHTNGTLDLNGQTLIVGTSYTTASGTKNITFNSGILRLSGSGTVFNNAQPTNFTTTAGTGSGEIQLTNASSAKTFAGNGSVYAATLAHNQPTGLTISGNNTFTSISSTPGGRTFNFTAGTTQTVENFTATGTSGNIVNLISTVNGTQWNITKSTGGTVSVDYMSIQDSNASPSSLTWYAGANSTSIANNNGWIFTAPPAPGGTQSNFLFLWAP